MMIVVQQYRVPVVTEFLEGHGGLTYGTWRNQFGYDDAQQSSSILLKSETDLEVKRVCFKPASSNRAT